MREPIPEADLLEQLASVVKTAGGTVTAQDPHDVNGTVTAIEAKWFLGGRKVTDSVTFRLVPDAHAVHFRERVVETSWGLSPPTFTVETTVQAGTRVARTRTDTAVGGGGRLDFGRVRDDIEKLVNESGWKFVFEVG